MAAAAANAPEDMLARGKRSVDDFVAASTEADIKGRSVLLLEDNAHLAALVRELVVTLLISPQRTDDRDRFLADVKALRGKLDELLHQLTGKFAAPPSMERPTAPVLNLPSGR